MLPGWSSGCRRGRFSAGNGRARCRAACWVRRGTVPAPRSWCTETPESARPHCSRYTVEFGQDLRVVRTVGVEGEKRLDYAALQQLCSPIFEFSGRLPDTQRDALGGPRSGSASGPAPSPLLVGLAVLGLLSGAAEKQPLLCVIDDAQWLDDASAGALGFVARRLQAERITLTFATA